MILRPPISPTTEDKTSKRVISHTVMSLQTIPVIKASAHFLTYHSLPKFLMLNKHPTGFHLSASMSMYDSLITDVLWSHVFWYRLMKDQYWITIIIDMVVYQKQQILISCLHLYVKTSKKIRILSCSIRISQISVSCLVSNAGAIMRLMILFKMFQY